MTAETKGADPRFRVRGRGTPGPPPLDPPMNDTITNGVTVYEIVSENTGPYGTTCLSAKWEPAENKLGQQGSSSQTNIQSAAQGKKKTDVKDTEGACAPDIEDEHVIQGAEAAISKSGQQGSSSQTNIEPACQGNERSDFKEIKAPYVTQHIQGINIQIGGHNVMSEIKGNTDETSEDGDAEPELEKQIMHDETTATSKFKEMTYAAAVMQHHTHNITAEAVTLNTYVQHVQVKKEPKSRKSLETPMKTFLEAVGDFENGHYILIAGKTSHVKHLEALSLVPWIAVFDFDPASRTKGLLSYVGENIHRRRSLHLLSWQDKCAINEESMCWIFANGRVEMGDSPRDDTFISWKSRTKDGIHQHIQQIQKFKDGYTNITVVVLWPSESCLAQHLNHLLYEMGYFTPKIVLTENNQEDSSIDSLCSFLKMQQMEVKRVGISVEQICKAMSHVLETSDEGNACKYSLPAADGSQDAGISAEQAMYLQEDLEVLYIDNTTGVEYTFDKIKLEEDTFLKGGSLTWSFRYATSAGHIDIERDILGKIKKHIVTKHIDLVRSGCVTVYHAPGSGGTTLAQRVLWDLHQTTPCVQAKHNPASWPQEIADRIVLLSERTRLPVLVLVDGEEEQKVDRLQRLLRDTCTIILYVKRNTADNENGGKNNGKFWLSRFVSVKEANCLGSKYVSQIKGEKKQKNIRVLVSDVSKGAKRMIFDFGLAAHSYKYEGLESYVRGFLKLQGDSHLPWQKALGFLSLAYYYGHTGVPCKFFSQMLYQNEQRVLTFDHLPAEMKEFIVKNHHEGRQHGVRISHYYVAKEILDQLLSSKQKKRKLSPTIAEQTKRKMSPVAIEFIKYSKQIHKEEFPASLSKTDTMIFITRDNRRVGEYEPEVINTKKRQFSQILEDVSSEAPYTERFDIFNQLVESFPSDPLVRSHLGRLYVICRPEMETQAEECFKEALKICHQLTKGYSKETIPMNLKLTLSHVHHMFGNMYFRRAQSKYRQTFLSEGTFHRDAPDLLELISTACENFRNCREMTPDGMEESYGYIGEIQARLFFCDSTRICSKGDILEYANKTIDSDNELERRIGHVIQDTFVSVDQLFIECFSVIDPDKIDFRIQDSQKLYASLFNVDRPGHINVRGENCTARRFQIAVRKGTYSNKKTPYVGLELVNRREDMHFIVQQYEENIREAFKNDKVLLSSRRELDIDFREWLYAIRHKNVCKGYSVEKVLQYVQMWYDALKTPYSRFYLFALKSILGFGSLSVVNNELLLQAQTLREEMMKYSKFMMKPKYPHEWLGADEDGIRRLAPGNRFFGRGIVPREASSDFRILTGTVLPPNDKPAAGFINVDLPTNSLYPLRAFYVPVRCEMKGKVYAGTRVEFSLAFTMFHGYDAFSVNYLQKLKCINCDNPNVEIRSCDDEVCCPRCQTINCKNVKSSVK